MTTLQDLEGALGRAVELVRAAGEGAEEGGRRGADLFALETVLEEGLEIAGEAAAADPRFRREPLLRIDARLFLAFDVINRPGEDLSTVSRFLRGALDDVQRAVDDLAYGQARRGP